MYKYILAFFYYFCGVINTFKMDIGSKIKKIRESKGFSQKEVALNLNMNPSQYSKIENGKVDPQCSSIEKIAIALGVNLSDVFAQENNLENINSIDKSIIEKVQLIDQLDDKQKESIFNIIDMAIYNIKLKQTLSNALAI